MLSKAELFKEKMNFIFVEVCENNLNTFTELFYIKGGKTDFEHRKINLKKNWLGKATISKTFPKEYEKYPFSLLIYNGEKLFKNVHDFLEMDLVRFQERIEAYVKFANRIIVPNDLDYKYLYIFNRYVIDGDENIDYYHIEYMGIEDNRVKIKVYAPQNIDRFNIKPYYGTLKQDGTKIILNFENSDDYISAIFNTDLVNRHSRYLVGVGSGIADINQKIAVAKKVVFSKEKIEDINTLYPILNETETISAIENSYEIKYTDRDFKAKHLHKYIDKIDRLNLLFKKLFQEKYYNSFYELLAFKEFSAIDNIFQKIKNNHSYFISNRGRIFDTLIKSYATHPYNSLNMVMPIYTKDNIFEYQSKKALLLQKNFIKLAQNVAMNIIFVIDNCNKPFSQEFKLFLEEIEPLARVYIVLKKNIENEVNSIDFLYTSKEDFVVSKFLRVDYPVFSLFQHQQSIEEHQAMYAKIFNRSISYKDFKKNRKKSCNPNPLIANISGEWYHYIYGSKKFWEDRVVIYEDGTVEYYCEEKIIERGEIINKEYQSIILLDDPITKRLFSITFDNQPYQIQKAFFTNNLVKQVGKNLNMFTVGILSRKKIPIEKAKEILGEASNVRYLEESSMRKRLGDYLVENS